ncbi:ribonuclease P protein subunit p25-like protein [Culicoides brevitarsis]|uniref:ribonuclease P protein subunit p25-like protein n=1 Tax=Culicoides brevitarsis TaxID=469753 RepID=UPI00307BE264
MENYRKGSNIEEELTKDRIPIPNLPENFLWMHVKGGTKVQNVIDYARKALDAGEYRSVVWSGNGGGVPKTISCAEIMKRHYHLHQVTQICYTKVEEIWEPLLEGLEQIVVKREIPTVHILTSLDEIDPSTPSYQCSGQATSMSFMPKAPKEKPFNIDAKRNPRKSKNPGNSQQSNSNKNQKKSKKPEKSTEQISSSSKMETEET